MLTTLLTASVLLAVMPVVSSAQPDVAQRVGVNLHYAEPSVTPDGTLDLDVRTTLTADAEYFEVRLRVYRPTGALMYQKTEVRHEVTSRTVDVGFSRELGDLGATAGRYPVEVRVLASGSEQTLVDSRLLVTDDTTPRLQVAVVARLDCTPALDPESRFALDPATHDVQRRAVDSLISIANGRGESITLGIPPRLLEEWAQAADGYQLTVPEGVVEIGADEAAPLAYASTLDALSRAAATGKVELLDVPYADPDLGGLQAAGITDDLASHYELGAPVYQEVLGVDPSTGTIAGGDETPASAVKTIAETGHAYFLCSSASVDGTATPGVYRESSTGSVALVTDDALAALVASGTAEDIYDRMYDAALSGAQAVVVTLDLGPGRDHTPDDVRRLLLMIDEASWLQAVPAARVAQAAPAETVSLTKTIPAPGNAPSGYWDEVGDASRYAHALVAAWAGDAGAGRSLSAALVSESRCWAGPDGSYPFADRARAFSASVIRNAKDALDGVSIEIRDVTLAARDGDVPLTIVSSADRPLTLTVTTRASRLEPHSTETTLLVQPADNFLTLPVDLGTAVSDTLEVRLMAGDVLVDEASVQVRASYLDRLTIVAMVVLVLLGLLWFIRRRVRAADAATMPGEAVIDPDDKHGLDQLTK